MTNKTGSSLNRRQVLAGTGAVAGVVALSGSARAESETPREESWDRETDIVVVGGGATGCTAAVIATQEGSKVILVEKAPALGGTTNKSGGVAWVPNNPLLQAKGIEDNREDCLKYMVRFSFPQRYDADSPTLGLNEREYNRIAAFYDNGAAAIEAIEATGAAKFAEFSVGAGVGAPPDYADHLPENKVPRGRSVVVIGPDGKPSPGRVGDGIFLINPLEEWLLAKDVPILTETTVTRVIKTDGRVVGVEVESGGKTEMIKANKGVIFGTGGYAHNTDLIKQHQKAAYGACAAAEATGDIIPLTGAVGAMMGDLSTAWRSQVVLEECLNNRLLQQCAFVLPADSMIVVNKHGNRVFNEKRNYNDRTEVHFVYDPVQADYPNQLLFMLFDSRAVNAFGDQYPIPHKPDQDAYTVQGATIEELAANLSERLEKLSAHIGNSRLDGNFADKLKATIDRYNGFAKTGEDLDFGRGSYSYDEIWQAFFSIIREDSTEKPNDLPNSAMYPLKDEGPYYAIILTAGVLDTSGGPEINEHAQILDVDGNPIPGLYGGGNCIASPSKEAYYGAGGTIGLCMAYGYIAAKHAHNS